MSINEKPKAINHGVDFAYVSCLELSASRNHLGLSFWNPWILVMNHYLVLSFAKERKGCSLVFNCFNCFLSICTYLPPRSSLSSQGPNSIRLTMLFSTPISLFCIYTFLSVHCHSCSQWYSWYVSWVLYCHIPIVSVFLSGFSHLKCLFHTRFPRRFTGLTTAFWSSTPVNYWVYGHYSISPCGSLVPLPYPSKPYLVTDSH